MGTRNLTMVIHQQEPKIAQYGQWDGYPSGQGSTALKFLFRMMNENKLDEFKKRLESLRWITKEEGEKLDAMDDWKSKYPYLSRDAGADILNAVLFNQMEVSEGIAGRKEIPVEVEFLSDAREFAGDSLFCEWAYVIDLDNETFEVYEGFNKQPLNESDRFFILQKEWEVYKPIRLVKSYSLRNLPSHSQMINDCSPSDSEE